MMDELRRLLNREDGPETPLDVMHEADWEPYFEELSPCSADFGHKRAQSRGCLVPLLCALLIATVLLPLVAIVITLLFH